jgi:hypothetical protein
MHNIKILKKVFDDALDGTNRLKGCLAIFMRQNEWVNGLTLGIRVDNEIENQAHKALK